MLILRGLSGAICLLLGSSESVDELLEFSEAWHNSNCSAVPLTLSSTQSTRPERVSSDRRSCHVIESEREMWKDVVPSMMSDEEDVGDNSFRIHRQEWRSQ